MKSLHSRKGFFHLWVGQYEVSVQVLKTPAGVMFLADDRLKGSNDARRQQAFTDAAEALRFIGYPVDIVGLPTELEL